MPAADKTVEALHEGFQALREDVKGIEASISKISDAITRLAVLEERHQGMAQAFSKLIEKVDTLTERQHQVELQREATASVIEQTRRNADEIRQLQLSQAQFAGKASGAGAFAKVLWTVVGGLVTAVMILAFNQTFVPASKAAQPVQQQHVPQK